ncbi:hypothetical protein M231_04282 [Tremella mesenterica]|uniref:Uncharacterized protein n=1 Tax=Tremella mesenterica TaxID=5217 RepID=A0A4Q1BLA7_TREME|nr:hypothetical protein M231_04282 [Tremella mesenterica]
MSDPIPITPDIQPQVIPSAEDILQEMQARIIHLEQELLNAQVHSHSHSTPTFTKEPKITSPPPFSGRKDEAGNKGELGLSEFNQEFSTTGSLVNCLFSNDIIA